MTSRERRTTDAAVAEATTEWTNVDAGLASAIFEAVGDSILVTDDRGIIQAVNKAALGCFGYTEPELLGQNVSVLMPLSEASVHDEYMQAYQRTGERKIIGIGRELVGQRKNGEHFELHLSIG